MRRKRNIKKQWHQARWQKKWRRVEKGIIRGEHRARENAAMQYLAYLGVTTLIEIANRKERKRIYSYVYGKL